MPNSSAVRRDVDLAGVVGVGEDAMPSFEVVAIDTLPVDAAIDGAECSRVEAANIERVGMLRIDRQIVDVLRFREERAPSVSAVF